MRLSSFGREYAHFPVSGLPATPGDLQLSFDAGATWATAAWVGSGSSRQAVVLVAGPATTGNPDGTVVLTGGRNFATARLVDNPEIVVRSVGSIDVYA